MRFTFRREAAFMALVMLAQLVLGLLAAALAVLPRR